MNAIQKKWSFYWETYQMTIDWAKAQQLETMFTILSNLVLKESGLNVRIPPHVTIRLAQGPLQKDQIIELVVASIDKMVHGILRPGAVEVPAAVEREEIHINNNFIVFKEWISEKRQIDLISIGVCGRRKRSFHKLKEVGISRDQFNKMSLEERQALLKEVLSQTL